MPKTHDMSKRYLGHDYTFKPIDGGQMGMLSGWLTPRPSHGDYLILQDGPQRTTRYQIIHIEYCMDPKDMFHARVKFAPRLPPSVPSIPRKDNESLQRRMH